MTSNKRFSNVTANSSSTILTQKEATLADKPATKGFQAINDLEKVKGESEDPFPMKLIFDQTAADNVAQDDTVFKNKGHRPGFTLEELDKFSYFSYDLKADGFGGSAGQTGRVFKSDTSDCAIARLTNQVPHHNKNGYLKYRQTAGEGLRWFKHLQNENADPSTVILVEGFFKALAAWKAGFNVIAYSGTSGCFDGLGVHPDLLELIEPYNKITLGYDIDDQDCKRANVESNILKLAGSLENKCATKIDEVGRRLCCTKEIYLVNCWDANNKDFDEILVNQGIDALRNVLSSVSTKKEWTGFFIANSYTATSPGHTESTEYLTTRLILELVGKHKLIFISAPMGAGKTTNIAEIIQQHVGKGQLVISPLIVLGRQICKDLRAKGITIYYREDISATDNWEAIIACLESISIRGKLKIKPDGSQMEGKILFIDEVSKVVANLLSGITISKRRAEVVQLLTALVRKADKVVCMGADLTNFDCQVIQKLYGDTLDPADVCKYLNTYKRNTFKGYLGGEMQASLALMHQMLSEGLSICVTIDSKDAASTYSGGNLADLFAHYSTQLGLSDVPETKILIIDSTTTKTINHEAYDVVVKGKKEILKTKQLVIASPSVEAGFSLLPNEYSPDAIFLFHMGVSDPDGLVQMSMRIRNLSIPRIFTFGGHSQTNFGGGLLPSGVKSYIRELKNKINEASSIKAQTKIKEDNPGLATGLAAIEDLSLNLDIEGLDLQDEYYQGEALKNFKRLHRQHYVISKLKLQGAHFEDKLPTTLQMLAARDNKAKLRGKLLETVKEKRVRQEATREFNAPQLTDKQVESLKDANALTQDQHDAKSKFYAQKQYKFDTVTVQDLVDKKKGMLEAETLCFWLTVGREFLNHHEFDRVMNKQLNVPIYNATKMLEDPSVIGKIYAQDAIKGAINYKVALLEKCGIQPALEFIRKYGIEDMYYEGYNLQKQNPQPLYDLLENLKQNKQVLITTFGWKSGIFHSQDETLLKHILQDLGFEFDDIKRIRAKQLATGKTVQLSVPKGVLPVRGKAARDKHFKALYQDAKGKYDRYVQTQLMVECGRSLVDTKLTQESVSLLLKKHKLEELIEASKILPRTEFGLSKLFELMSVVNKFECNIGIPTVIVSEDRISAKLVLEKTLKQWQLEGTTIGIDLETHESDVHREICIQKNGKWYWENPQIPVRDLKTGETHGKLQLIKPGLDQNHNLTRVISLSDGKTQFAIDLGLHGKPTIPDWFKDSWNLLLELGQTNTFVGHNLKFDTSSIRKYGLVIKKPYCSMITTMLTFGDCGAGKVLNGFKVGTKVDKKGIEKPIISSPYALQSVAKNLLGIKINKEDQTSNWGAETLTEGQFNYAAKDATVALIEKQLLDLVIDDPINWGLAEFAGSNGKHANKKLIMLENSNIYQTTEMQWRGIPCNTKKVQERIEKLKQGVTTIEANWQILEMPCKPSQAQKVVKELNKRYVKREFPFTVEELIEALGVELIDDDDNLLSIESLEMGLELPSLKAELVGTGKDVINDNPDIAELQLLKAWRSYKSAIVQLSKVLLSAQINNGVCKTEYKPLSGTGRMACGNEFGLGTPNLQAFSKKAEGRYYGIIQQAETDSTTGKQKRKLIDWWLPSISEEIKIRDVFELTDYSLSFISEDANSSHARLAIGFGKCEFGKKSQIGGLDSHSMFAMMALQAILKHDPKALDGSPAFQIIRDFVKDLTEAQIRTEETTKNFKALDKKHTGERFRSAAKTLFYSVLNGAQADKMRKVLSSAVGSSISIAAGTEMFESFWSLYKGIDAYIKKILAEAEANSVNYGGIEFNITTLPDGVKLLYARKEGELATTNIIACQWSRAEATALKNVMASIERLDSSYGAVLVNMVHDEVGVVCKAEYWQDIYRFMSDKFAEEYDKYLNGFIPCDEPTDVKLQKKLADNINYIPRSWADK